LYLQTDSTQKLHRQFRVSQPALKPDAGHAGKAFTEAEHEEEWMEWVDWGATEAQTSGAGSSSA